MHNHRNKNMYIYSYCFFIGAGSVLSSKGQKSAYSGRCLASFWVHSFSEVLEEVMKKCLNLPPVAEIFRLTAGPDAETALRNIQKTYHSNVSILQIYRISGSLRRCAALLLSSLSYRSRDRQKEQWHQSRKNTAHTDMSFCS